MVPNRLDRRRVAGLAGASLWVALLTTGYAFAYETSASEEQASEIVFTPLSCWPSQEHLVLRARVAPPEDVQKTLVYFRWDRHAAWYFVPMTPTGTGWEAILPMTDPTATGVVYYFESISSSYMSTRSERQRVQVRAASDCRDDPAAVIYSGSNPNITVGATQVGAPVPPGFQTPGIQNFISPTGMTSTTGAGGSGGGISGRTMAFIGGGGAAGAAAFAFGGGGGGGDSGAAPAPLSDGISGGPTSIPTTSSVSGPSSTTSTPSGSGGTTTASGTTSVGSGTTTIGSGTTSIGSGTTSIGTSTVGTTSIGTSTIGTTSIGTSTIGTTSIGTSTIGTTSIATSTIGTTSIATSTIGTTSVATTSVATTIATTSVATSTIASTIGDANLTFSISAPNNVTVGSDFTISGIINNTGSAPATFTSMRITWGSGVVTRSILTAGCVNDGGVGGSCAAIGTIAGGGSFTASWRVRGTSVGAATHSGRIDYIDDIFPESATDSKTTNVNSTLRAPDTTIQFQSTLETTGSARGRIVVNDATAVEAGLGTHTLRAPLADGVNRFQATYFPVGGSDGTWRFDFTGTDGVVPGSLRVEAGRVVSVDGRSVVFAVGPETTGLTFTVRARGDARR